MENWAKGKDYIIYAKAAKAKMKWIDAFQRQRERVAEDKGKGKKLVSFPGLSRGGGERKAWGLLLADVRKNTRKLVIGYSPCFTCVCVNGE